MARARLINTASAGQSEVLSALAQHGARHSGVGLGHVGTIVSRTVQGTENRSASDPQFEGDVLTVLRALAGLGLIKATNPATGAVVALTPTPPSTTRITFTDAGQIAARHPKPRPRALRG